MGGGPEGPVRDPAAVTSLQAYARAIRRVQYAAEQHARMAARGNRAGVESWLHEWQEAIAAQEQARRRAYAETPAR